MRTCPQTVVMHTAHTISSLRYSGDAHDCACRLLAQHDSYVQQVHGYMHKRMDTRATHGARNAARARNHISAIVPADIAHV
eukprot:6391161-Lingulodinium_polyedra.AAC.1